MPKKLDCSQFFFGSKQVEMVTIPLLPPIRKVMFVVK